jgi:hypothetical protein
MYFSVRRILFLTHPKDRYINMSAPNHAERFSAIERSCTRHERDSLFASVDNVPGPGQSKHTLCQWIELTGQLRLQWDTVPSHNHYLMFFGKV